MLSPPPTPAPAGENSFDLEGLRPSDPAGERADASRSDESSQNPSGWFAADACTAAPRALISSAVRLLSRRRPDVRLRGTHFGFHFGTGIGPRVFCENITRVGVDKNSSPFTRQG